MFFSILEQSLIFLPLTLGVYISYGVLRIPDLATDGSFVLGAALVGITLSANLDPLIGMAIATLGGVAVGMATSFLQTRMSLNPLIAGILMVFILNSLVIKVMGRPNISLFELASVFDRSSKIVVLAVIGMSLIALCSCFLASRLGLMLHAFGNNPQLLNLSGKSSSLYRTMGLSISNGLVAFSGALSAQASGFADISMGTGMILVAIGTVIIGLQIYDFVFKHPSYMQLKKMLCCALGVCVYFATVNGLIAIGLDPIYLRLMIGLCLIGFLGLTKQAQGVAA